MPRSSNAHHRLAQSLRQASPYIAQHRGKTLVVYFPSSLLHDSQALDTLAKDCVLLNSLGLKLIVTLGAGAWLDQAYQQAGLPWETHRNTRITQAHHLDLLERTLGQAKAKVESAFTKASAAHQLPAALVSGNWVTAKPKGVIDGVDFQHTGSVRKINQEAIWHTLNAGQMLLVTPLAYSFSGEAFNINTLEQSFAIAKQLQAHKLMLFQPQKVLEKLPAAISHTEVDQWPLPAPLLQSLIAQAQGIQRIHLMAQTEPDALLLELFTRDGAGTLVYTDRYHQLRRALPDDIVGIMRLIRPLEQAGILVKRSAETLENTLEQFWVLDLDQHLIGCSALSPIDADNAELNCFVIDPEYQDQHLGQELLTAMQTKAFAQGYKHLWLLTTHTHHWFIEQGFALSDPQQLPSHRQKLYNEQRNSKVLVKTLERFA